jgi:transcriptional regulator with XRE-family HTH domain
MTPEQFKQARLKLGLTQKKLADKLKLSRVTISYYETGAVRIMPKNLSKVLKLLREFHEERAKKEEEFRYLLKN